jgi:hypothetical protein
MGKHLITDAFVHVDDEVIGKALERHSRTNRKDGWAARLGAVSLAARTGRSKSWS